VKRWMVWSATFARTHLNIALHDGAVEVQVRVVPDAAHPPRAPLLRRLVRLHRRHPEPYLALLHLNLNSVSGLVSKVWYRIPFDQSELSISKISPTDSPKVRPGYDP